MCRSQKAQSGVSCTTQTSISSQTPGHQTPTELAKPPALLPTKVHTGKLVFVFVAVTFALPGPLSFQIHPENVAVLKLHGDAALQSLWRVPGGCGQLGGAGVPPKFSTTWLSCNAMEQLQRDLAPSSSHDILMNPKKNHMSPKPVRI